MNDFLAISKALSDESRVRTLLCLRGGERCVCQIVELLGLAPSTVSKHLFLLRHAGLIEARKAGKWMHYRLAGASAAPEIRRAIDWTIESTRGRPRIAEDDARLLEILNINPEALCLKQRACSLIDDPKAAAQPTSGLRWSDVSANEFQRIPIKQGIAR